jgi:hypothetical protein
MHEEGRLKMAKAREKLRTFHFVARHWRVLRKFYIAFELLDEVATLTRAIQIQIAFKGLYPDTTRRDLRSIGEEIWILAVFEAHERLMAEEGAHDAQSRS